MKNISFIATIKENSGLITTVTVVAVVIAVAISLLQPFQYKAESTLLVIQNQAGLDAYTATKSAEKIGKNLSQVVTSTAFYDDVTAIDPSVKVLFSTDEIKRRKEWKRDLEVELVPETGILKLAAYNIDKERSASLLETVSFVLINDGDKYHGGGNDVVIKKIDDVSVGKFPVRPNIILNSLFAAICGFVASAIYAFLKQAQKVSGYVLEMNSNSANHSGLNLAANKLRNDKFKNF